ncbi:MAG TPA: BON domain-containing protein, partial [Blastocatellia bacterium]
MKGLKYSIVALAGALLLSGSVVLATPPDSNPQAGNPALVQTGHRELATLPYYGVFDNLEYQVNGTTVTLSGQVVRPVTKSDAESRVKHIEGVTSVVDNIQVLPLSPMDNGLRIR